MADQEQQVSIDVRGYPEAKAKSGAQIRKIDGAYFYCTRKFDPNTGDPTPAHNMINRKMFEDFRAQVVKDSTETIAAVDMLLADIDAVKEV